MHPQMRCFQRSPPQVLLILLPVILPFSGLCGSLLQVPSYRELEDDTRVLGICPGKSVHVLNELDFSIGWRRLNPRLASSHQAWPRVLCLVDG